MLLTMLQQCNSNYKDLTRSFREPRKQENMRNKLLVAFIGSVLFAGTGGATALGQELPGDYQAPRRGNFLIGKDGKIVEEQVDKEAIDPTKIVDACQRPKMKE